VAVTGDQILAAARKYIGVPYLYGGDTPSGLDCSGLVQLTLKGLGIDAPRTSEQQWQWVKRIPWSQVRPGDLVFFTGSPIDPPPGHVGFVVSTNPPVMLDALMTGTNVRTEPISDAGSPTGYGRVPSATPGTGAGAGATTPTGNASLDTVLALLGGAAVPAVMVAVLFGVVILVAVGASAAGTYAAARAARG
jgi:peptidoglycan DL-endopeptidase CwlO